MPEHDMPDAKSRVVPVHEPQQARAKATFNALLLGAQHILQEDGINGLNSNVIAEPLQTGWGRYSLQQTGWKECTSLQTGREVASSISTTGEIRHVLSLRRSEQNCEASSCWMEFSLQKLANSCRNCGPPSVLIDLGQPKEVNILDSSAVIFAVCVLVRGVSHA